MSKKEISAAFDDGNMNAHDAHYSNLSFRNCGLSTGRKARSRFNSCKFSNLEASECSIGYPLFQDCVFENIRCSDVITTYGTVFSECKFKGRIEGFNFGICPEMLPSLDGKLSAPFVKEDQDCHSRSAFSLDVREAILVNVTFVGAAIASRVIFLPGQCAIFSGENLQETMGALFSEVDDSIKRAFLPPVLQNQESHMVPLDAMGLSERVDTIRDFALAKGLTFRDTPIAHG